MIGFSIEYDPTPAVSMLDRIIEAMRDLSPLYEQVLEPAFYEWQQERFATGGGESHWEQLSARYASWKAQHFPGQPLLVATGNLRAGLTSGSGVGNVRRIDATTMEVGTSDWKADFHQQSRGSSGRVPQRKLIDPSSSVQQHWQDLGERYFERVAKAAGA